MRTRFVGLLLPGVFGLLAVVLTTSAAARTTALQARTLTVHLTAAETAKVPGGGPLAWLGLDGTQAAYVADVPVTAADQLGQRLYRWNLATGRSSVVSGAKTYRIPETSTGRGISAIALAGSQSAWLVSSGGNTESSETLLTSTAKAHQDKVLSRSDRFSSGDSGGSAGTWIGGLVSDGSRIWYATWSTKADQTVTKSALWRISGSTAKKIASGSGAVVATSADDGRIALLRTDDSVAIYSSDGRLLKTFAAAGPAVGGVVLTGNLVGALTQSRPGGPSKSIDVYNRKSGALLHSWPAIGGYSWEFDAYGGVAVYAKGARLHAINLRSGKDVVVAKPSRAIEVLRFDRAGLLYFFNGRWSPKNGQDGKLVFVPFRSIAGKLGA